MLLGRSSFLRSSLFLHSYSGACRGPSHFLLHPHAPFPAVAASQASPQLPALPGRSRMLENSVPPRSPCFSCSSWKRVCRHLWKVLFPPSDCCVKKDCGTFLVKKILLFVLHTFPGGDNSLWDSLGSRGQMELNLK